MRTAAAFISIALLAAPAAAFAQQGLVAPREGNVWGGIAHEPYAPSVHNAERAQGVAQPAAQAQQQNQEVEQLANQLLMQSSH